MCALLHANNLHILVIIESLVVSARGLAWGQSELFRYYRNHIQVIFFLSFCPQGQKERSKNWMRYITFWCLQNRLLARTQNSIRFTPENMWRHYRHRAAGLLAMVKVTDTGEKWMMCHHFKDKSSLFNQFGRQEGTDWCWSLPLAWWAYIYYVGRHTHRGKYTHKSSTASHRKSLQ